MADSGEPGSASHRPGAAFDSHDETALRHAIELLFFAYRDFTAEADAMLARYGFGRAHHRVVYFVGQNPGATVSELLSLLKITKQSLSRVLSQLMREGFIVQKGDVADRRRRRLYLTAEAKALEQRLTERQMALLARAFAEAGAPAEAGFRAVLRAMINFEDRRRFAPPVTQDIVTIHSR
jgi:DNA-binding MarR family transcriptional regulator